MRPVIRYWGRKAGSIAESYIAKHSQPKEIVLDPFGGAGSIIKAALKLGRRAIYSDLNPLAALIARVEIEGADPYALTVALENLLKRQRLHYRDSLGRRHWIDRSNIYAVICKCGTRKQARYFLYNGDTIETAKVYCANCGNGLVRCPYNGIEAAEPLYEFPKVSLQYSNGVGFQKRRHVNTIAELFTPRNLIVLSALLRDIKKLKTDDRTKRALLVGFASILYQASKMSRLNGGTWCVNSYWIPTIHVERNPYFLFSNALKRLGRIEKLADAHTSAEPVIAGHASLAILNSDATELPLPDNSIDLVITDPPFTDEIQYFELSYLAASWLGLPMPFDREIVVNHKQGKKLDQYYRLLSKAFSELYRVLKAQRAAVIMLHEEKEIIMKDLIQLVASAGFVIAEREEKYMVQRHIGDRDRARGRRLLILTCYKL